MIGDNAIILYTPEGRRKNVKILLLGIRKALVPRLKGVVP